MADNTTPTQTGVDRRPSTSDVLGSSYDVQLTCFPPKLAWLKESENYVVFYINVPDKVSLNTNESTIGEVQPIEGVSLETNTSSIFNAGRPYKRLNHAIVLPIMERPTAKYAADWDMTALGPVLGWAMTHGFDTNSGGSVFNKAGQSAYYGYNLTMDALKAVGLSAINSAANVVGLGGSAGTADIFSVLRRTALNEHRTQIFKSMRFRNFDFNYRLAPRNQQEATIIKTIIQTFKFHMHPDPAGTNLFLTYPSEFDIVFYFKGGENTGSEPQQQNLFKISTCALTDFQVDYGGAEFYTFDDGMPTEITMRLSFLELELLTRKRVSQGF